MKKRNLSIVTLVLLALIFSLYTGQGLKELHLQLLENPYSPISLSFSSSHDALLVLEATAHRLDLLDTNSGQLTKAYQFEGMPTGMYADQNRLVVSTDEDQGQIIILDPESLAPVKKFKAGSGARSPLVLPERSLLAVCHTFLDEVGFYSLPDGNCVATLPVLRQPSVCVASNDGKYLFVANFITHQRADQDTVASAVTVIDLDQMRIDKHLLLANGSNALRGMTISSNGEYVLVSHNLGRFQVPTTQLEQGWMNTSALSVIQVSTLSYAGTVLLDEPEYGAAGSWGISCFDGLIMVAHSGTHDVSMIDEKAFFKKLEATENRDILSYDLSFLSGIRERVKLEGNGPRATWAGPQGLFVGMYFSDAVNQLVKEGKQWKPRILALNQGFYESEVRLGEKYFNDATYCFQGWQSCNGCHPMEARTDGLNWDLLNDGVGNPKNCKSLLLSHHTPPVMISGIRPDAETAVRAGFRYIQFAQVSDEHASAVDAYLSSLKPRPSPFLVDGKLSEKAQKGAQVFERLGCQNCHPAPLYTDLAMHLVGHPSDPVGKKEWDTPTLIEVWRSGPWLYDGRCATMETVFARELHGLEEPLSAEELEELVAFVLSI